MAGGDLWKSEWQGAGTLRPATEQQAAAREIARLGRRPRRLLAVACDPWVVAITDEDGRLLLVEGKQPYEGVEAAVRVNVSASAPLSAVHGACEPLLGVLTDQGCAVLDARTGEPRATVDGARLMEGGLRDDIVEEVRLLNTDQALIVYFGTRAGYSVRWGVDADAVQRVPVPHLSTLGAAVHRGQRLIVAGCSDGTRVWREADFLGQREASRGPVAMAAAGRVGGRALAVWVATGPAGGTLWVADGNTGRIVTRRELRSQRQPEALMLGAVDGQPVVVVMPDAYYGKVVACGPDESWPDLEFDVADGWPERLTGFGCAAVATRQEESNQLYVSSLVALATGGPRMEVWSLVADSGLRFGLIAQGRRDLGLRRLRDGSRMPFPSTDALGGDVGTAAVALVDGRPAAVITVRHRGGARSVWFAREWDGAAAWRQILPETRSYSGHVAVAAWEDDAIIAFGTEFGVTVLTDREHGSPITVPQPATTLAFDDSGRLLIGTERGPILLDLRSMLV